MSKYKFTATHGVHLWDLGVRFEPAGEVVEGGGRSRQVYAFETDDKGVADALGKVDGYGIRRVGGAPEPESEDEDEGDGLDGLKVAELREIADQEGVDLGDATRKADIVAALRDARD